MFSIWFRSGLRTAHWRTGILFLLNQASTTPARCIAALSCWNIQFSQPISSESSMKTFSNSLQNSYDSKWSILGSFPGKKMHPNHQIFSFKIATHTNLLFCPFVLPISSVIIWSIESNFFSSEKMTSYHSCDQLMCLRQN